LTKNPSK